MKTAPSSSSFPLDIWRETAGFWGVDHHTQPMPRLEVLPALASHDGRLGEARTAEGVVRLFGTSDEALTRALLVHEATHFLRPATMEEGVLVAAWSDLPWLEGLDKLLAATLAPWELRARWAAKCLAGQVSDDPAQAASPTTGFASGEFGDRRLTILAGDMFLPGIAEMAITGASLKTLAEGLVPEAWEEEDVRVAFQGYPLIHWADGPAWARVFALAASALAA